MAAILPRPQCVKQHCVILYYWITKSRGCCISYMNVVRYHFSRGYVMIMTKITLQECINSLPLQFIHYSVSDCACYQYIPAISMADFAILMYYNSGIITLWELLLCDLPRFILSCNGARTLHALYALKSLSHDVAFWINEEIKMVILLGSIAISGLSIWYFFINFDHLVFCISWGFTYIPFRQIYSKPQFFFLLRNFYFIPFYLNILSKINCYHDYSSEGLTPCVLVMPYGDIDLG